MAVIAWTLAVPVAAIAAPASPEFQVNTYTTSSQSYPDAAVGVNGDFVIVWDSCCQDGSGSGIFGRLFDSGGAPLGPEFQINTFTSGEQAYPAVTRNAAGGFVVAWESGLQDGSATGIFARRYDSAGAPAGAEFQVNAYTTGYQYFAAIASDAAGDFVVAWASEQDGDATGIFARRYDSAGAPSGAEFQVNTYTTGKQGAPAVVMDAAGDFVVAWHSPEDGDGYGVFARRFATSGSPLSGEFQVNTAMYGDQVYPSAAIDSTGRFIVVWRSPDISGSGFDIHGQRYDAAGALVGPEFRANSFGVAGNAYPSVALDDAGRFVVAWHAALDGSSYGIFGRRFDATGTAFLPQFQINEHTLDVQINPALAANASGDFVVAWQSYGQDGSGYGVFARSLTCPDTDGDGICDPEDIVLTSPVAGDALDCSDPKALQPTIAWSPGAYDRFRVLLAASPGFTRASRVASGSGLLASASWAVPARKWVAACAKAKKANAVSPTMYVEVFGVDRGAAIGSPTRKTFSQIVQVDVLP